MSNNEEHFHTAQLKVVTSSTGSGLPTLRSMTDGHPGKTLAAAGLKPGDEVLVIKKDELLRMLKQAGVAEIQEVHHVNPS